MQVNVIATERLFHAAVNAKLNRVVFTSSLYAYGSLGPESMCETDLASPTTLYGSSKLMGWSLIS
ncbi:unannotated protein [freshwater metagenome]|uniref:Unannotated protein n=1 Tax=freshwater metagenome TaxID=449393 RepID=A0A6J6WI56_9ZZZZ